MRLLFLFLSIFLSSVSFFVVYTYAVLCTICTVLARTKWRIYNAVGQAVMTGGAFLKRERAEFMERSKIKEKNTQENNKNEYFTHLDMVDRQCKR